MSKNKLTNLFCPEMLLLPIVILLVALMLDDRIGFLNLESGLDGFQTSLRLIGIWFGLELLLFIGSFVSSIQRSYNIRWLMLLIPTTAIPILTFQQIEERSIAMVELAEIDSKLLEGDRVWRRIRDDEENERSTTTYAQVNGRQELTALNFYLEETDCGCCFSDYRTDFSDEKARWLTSCRYLQTMDLSESSITDNSFVHFRQLPRLKTLDVSNNQITGSGFKHLAGHRSLKELILNDCPIEDHGLKDLALVSSLEKISLYQTPVTDVGIGSLGRLPNLKSLTYRGTKLAGRSLGSFNGCQNLNFISIRCDRPRNGEAGPAQLLNGSTRKTKCVWNDLPSLKHAHVNVDASVDTFEICDLGELSTLDVKFRHCPACRVGEPCKNCEKAGNAIRLENLPSLFSLKIEGASAIEATNLPKISHLVLSDSESFLPQVRRFSKLKSLEIADSNLSFESLCQLGDLPQLESLTISCVDEEALAALSQFANLIKLKVTRVDVGRKGAEAISKLENLEELELVNVRGNNSPLESLNQLKKLKSLKLNYGEIDRLKLSGLPDFHFFNPGVSCTIGQLYFEDLPAMESFSSFGDIKELVLRNLVSLRLVRNYSFDDQLPKRHDVSVAWFDAAAGHTLS